MTKKVPGYFSYKALMTSLCFLSFADIHGLLIAAAPPKLGHNEGAKPHPKLIHDEGAKYTMNFRNVAIVEYIRFVAKISKTNFIFNEAELVFPVTLVSDQPVSAKNLFAALVQVLEVNGFNLSDQEGSVLITKSQGSSQLGALNQLQAPLITRIFKIQNINIATMTQIIKSIVSKGALVEAVAETHQLIITDTGPSLEKLAELIQNLDTAGSNLKILSYTVKNQSASVLSDILKQVILPFQGANSYLTIPQANNNHLLIVSTPFLIAQTEEALLALDIPEAALPIDSSSGNVYLYAPKSRKISDIKIALLTLAESLKQEGPSTQSLVAMINSIKTPEGSNSILFIGSKPVWQKLQEMLLAIDNKENFSTLYVYHIRSMNPKALEALLHETANKADEMGDPEHLAQAIDNMTYIPSTNSLVFSGMPQAIEKLKMLLPSMDKEGLTESIDTSFIIYELKNTSGDLVLTELKQLEPKFSKDAPELIPVIESIKWLQNSNSLLIHGSKKNLDAVQALISNLDSPKPQKGMVIYNLKMASGETVVTQLHEMSLHITDTSQQSLAIKKSLETARFLPDTNSIMLNGSKEATTYIQTLIEKIDVAPQMGQDSSFFLYKLQSQPAEKVIEKLQQFAAQLPSNNPNDKNLILTIKRLQVVRDNNSILITGSQKTIDKVSSLIAQYDTSVVTKKDNKNEFFIYSPVHLNLEALEESVQEYAVALKQSGLEDQDLIETINTAKSVPSANHLIFTGNAESLAKLKTILAVIDQTAPQSQVKQLGQSTFYVYQLKSLTPDQFSSMLKNFESSLSKTGNTDPAITKAIDHMQYLKETNSFLFTGPATALEKIKEMIAKIDIDKSTVTSDMTYEIYTPHYLGGLDLIEHMCQFAQGLSDSGVKDQSLFETIDNIKWIAKSNSMIITGSPDSIAKVQDLLKKLDIPGNNKEGSLNSSSGFMVYKLQYHSGTEIQQALNNLAPSFIAAGPNPNPGLASAINSIQWIQATNSLVASGDADNLEKLRTLITEIDMPLKQVFIEVLVVETDTNNTQNFGLQWFGKGNIKNQLGFGTGNFGGPNLTGVTTVPALASAANAVTLTQPPTGSSIPLTGNGSAGFDLGVIGDVLFHKGQSFVSLGSLVNALQVDSDSTIVMNPKIISQDNQNSKIFIGQNIPFLGSNVTNAAQNTITTQNIEYRDVGTNLSITPKLGDDNVITLEITYNQSNQVANTSGGVSNGFQGIQTSQTNLTTRVHVPDQHFVVLSGMLQDTKQHFKTGIPCLGGLPIIGLAFSDTERTSNKTNILIFIRPSIVHNMDDLRELTQKQEDKYRELLDRQIDKEDFDQALNILKYSSDE